MYLETHKTSLWVQAFDALSDDDKQDLKTAETETVPRPQEIVQAVEIKRQECAKKQWVVFTNKAGEKVLFRDILGKVVKWVERFQQVGDTAVQYDPGHAALPWMVVRALLNVSLPPIRITADAGVPILLLTTAHRWLSTTSRHLVPWSRVLRPSPASLPDIRSWRPRFSSASPI